MYKSGHSHGTADALSRLPLPVTTRVEAEESVLLLREVEDFPLTANQISNWTHRDACGACASPANGAGRCGTLHDVTFYPL